MSMDSTPLSKHTIWKTVFKKEDLTIYFQETHLIDKNKHWLRVKDWKKIYRLVAHEIRQE
jgi:hypothetical protein